MKRSAVRRYEWNIKISDAEVAGTTSLPNARIYIESTEF
jgi:hypothetical protein